MTTSTAPLPNPLIRQAIWLSWFTIGYNIIEGLVSIGFGIEEGSVALFGFGVDSFVEVFSALVVLWRFQGEAHLGAAMSPDREQKASLAIGWLFLILAGVTAFGGLAQILSRKHPDTTLPGVIVSIVSLSFMVFLWAKKKEVGTKLGSQTVVNDAACSMACIKLSAVLFVGSGVFYFAPQLWWADALAAIVMSYFIFQEGREMRAAAKAGKIACCGCS